MLSVKWLGVEGDHDVARTQERSQPDDPEEYLQSRDLCGSFKTVFSFKLNSSFRTQSCFKHYLGELQERETISFYSFGLSTSIFRYIATRNSLG